MYFRFHVAAWYRILKAMCRLFVIETNTKIFISKTILNLPKTYVYFSFVVKHSRVQHVS